MEKIWIQERRFEMWPEKETNLPKSKEATVMFLEF